jgi:hypothetical protein
MARVATKVGYMHSYSEVKVIARVAAYIKVAGELDMQGLEVLDLQVKAMGWAKLVLEVK